MRARVMAKGPQIIRDDHRRFRREQAGAMERGIKDPIGPRFCLCRRTRMLVEKDDSVGVALDRGRWRLHRLLQIGHNHVDARGQCFGLPCAQVIGKARDIGV